MAQQFSCVVDGCEFMVQSPDEDEVVDMVDQHRERHHPDMDVSESEIRDNMQRT